MSTFRNIIVRKLLFYYLRVLRLKFVFSFYKKGFNFFVRLIKTRICAFYSYTFGMGKQKNDLWCLRILEEKANLMVPTERMYVFTFVFFPFGFCLDVKRIYYIFFNSPSSVNYQFHVLQHIPVLFYATSSSYRSSNKTFNTQNILLEEDVNVVYFLSLKEKKC